MSAKLPVVFLAFANDMDSHLATLKDESRALYAALQPLEQTNAISVHREESVEFDELYQDLLAFDGRIVVFHYAGHADGTMLQLEGGNGGAGGIASLLGQQTSLKLVFLNGCATKDQVKLLHDAGVPAVIATAVKISDSKATQLSNAFYAALVKGHSIYQAFDSAKAYIEGKFDGDSSVSFTVNRHPNFNFAQHEQESSQSLEFEWTLYTREDCVADIEQWRLTQAQQDWVVELQDNNGVIRDLDNKPIKIEYQARVRTLDVLTCLHCNTTTSLSEENLQQCPLCDSSDIKRHQAQSNVPELNLPFDIDRPQATEIALAAAGLNNSASNQSPKISLRKVYIPFWVFDLETRTHLNAQRGAIKDIHADTLELEWDDVSEDIDLVFESFMVPGFTGQIITNKDSDGWHWTLEQSTQISQYDSSIPVIPFEVSPQSGFDQFFAYLSEQLTDEAYDRASGQQQKNAVLSTRYKHISLISIFLPHWCAVLSHDTQTTSIVINGQSGAIRFSPSSNKPAIANLGHTSMNQKSAILDSVSNTVSPWVSVFSGVGIGVMVGLLMGLAAPQDEGAKSIVAIFIGAVGVVLAALLGLNDRHFSSAKGLRIGSFGLAVALSALSGIYVRDNHLLSPSITQRAEELKKVFKGIDNKELIGLLRDTKITTKADGTVVEESSSINKGVGALFSASGVKRSLCSKLKNSYWEPASFTGKELVDEFRYIDAQNGYGWKNLADAVEKQLPDSEADQKSLLLIARDSVCGFNQLTQITPEFPECNKINRAIDGAKMRALFSDSDSLHPILIRIEDEIKTKENQSKALMLMKPVLCSLSTEKSQ
jgi:hypothetical protein